VATSRTLIPVALSAPPPAGRATAAGGNAAGWTVAARPCRGGGPSSTRHLRFSHQHISHAGLALYSSRSPRAISRPSAVVRCTALSLLPPWRSTRTTHQSLRALAFPTYHISCAHCTTRIRRVRSTRNAALLYALPPLKTRKRRHFTCRTAHLPLPYPLARRHWRQLYSRILAAGTVASPRAYSSQTPCSHAAGIPLEGPGRQWEGWARTTPAHCTGMTRCHRHARRRRMA